jgi:hypothetical protein
VEPVLQALGIIDSGKGDIEIKIRKQQAAVAAEEEEFEHRTI